MASAHQLRDLITQTSSGTVRPRVPREVRDEVCRYAARRRKAGARPTNIDSKKKRAGPLLGPRNRGSSELLRRQGY